MDDSPRTANTTLEESSGGCKVIQLHRAKKLRHIPKPTSALSRNAVPLSARALIHEARDMLLRIETLMDIAEMQSRQKAK